jgi:hypothetical protein
LAQHRNTAQKYIHDTTLKYIYEKSHKYIHYTAQEYIYETKQKYVHETKQNYIYDTTTKYTHKPTHILYKHDNSNILISNILSVTHNSDIFYLVSI